MTRRSDQRGALRPFEQSQSASAPDLILLNDKVFTGDPARKHAQAIAITGERIAAVGETNEIAAMASAGTRRIDIRGRVVIPGFNDAHFHHTPDPRATVLPFSSMEPTWDEVLELVAAAAKEAPNETWILGTHGINVVNESRATRFDLDRVAPDHPVRLWPYFGHGTVLNTRALTALGMSAEEPDPFGGCCERVEHSKQITGKLFGYAQWRPWRRLAQMASETEVISSAQQLAEQAVRLGITSLQVMSLLPPGRYVPALGRAQLPIRIRVIRFPPTGPDSRDVSDGRDMRARSEASRVTLSGTKWLLDGTPLERRALRKEMR